MSRHTTWQELDRHARDLLEGSERLAVQAHVHECAECTASLRRLREEEETLRTVLAPEDADEEVVERVAAAAAAGRRAAASTVVQFAPARASVPRASAFIPLAAAAAVIVTVIVATREIPKAAPQPDPVVSAIDALATGAPGADAKVHRLGRKCLPELRRAEAGAEGESRARLAGARAWIEQALPRVLWVEDQPRYEYRVLQPVLMKDRTFLVQTLRLDIPESMTSMWAVQFPFRTQIRTFPLEDLQSYDVVMLGDLRVAEPDPLRGAVETFAISYGGSVLMIAGEHSADVETTLASISPVDLVQAGRPQQVFVRLTPEGLTHPATDCTASGPREEFYGGLPSLRWYQTVRARKGAEVLVETREGAPLLTTWEVGRGRVAHLASDDQWHWGMECQASFYRAILNFLVRRE